MESQSSYDLHLRSAGLDNNEVKSIAEAIGTVHANGGPSLKSFSISYNPNLRDQGVLDLVKALPATVTEIGLVGCGVQDVGGPALLNWASKAPKLHWLCVEQNHFTAKIKESLITLGKQRSGLLVIV